MPVLLTQMVAPLALFSRIPPLAGREVAVPMLVDTGCRYVILGHSERRHVLGERNEVVGRKVAAAIAGGLDVILCVGELLSEREANRTETVLDSQMEGGLAEIAESSLDHVTLAYEPVWAIGTGRTATPAQAVRSAPAITPALSTSTAAASCNTARP